MKQVTPFVISEFTNPSGKIVFQLYARLDGQRFRKNFQTRAEAEAERQVQEVSWLQRDTGTRAAVTRLNEDQLHEAEAAFRRLANLPRSLSFYLDFALANYREPEKQKPLADAVREPRKVTIQPNLAAWLKAYPLDKGPIILGNFKKRRDRFAKKFNLTHDVLRHTFISMFVAKFRSIGEAAIQAGSRTGVRRINPLLADEECGHSA